MIGYKTVEQCVFLKEINDEDKRGLIEITSNHYKNLKMFLEATKKSSRKIFT